MHIEFMSRRLALVALVASAWLGTPVFAADEAPDAMIKRLTSEVMRSIKSDPAIQSGDLARTIALVDTQIMPSVDFHRMTASAVGPAWRRATPEQQQRLRQEFKTLLVRTYAGALAQASDQVIVVKPLRAAADDKEVVVRTEARGKGESIQIDYRLVKMPVEGAGWKIYNLNVVGVWLVETYRSQFSQEINANGLDGLINTLAERNKANAAKG